MCDSSLCLLCMNSSVKARVCGRLRWGNLHWRAGSMCCLWTIVFKGMFRQLLLLCWALGNDCNPEVCKRLSFTSKKHTCIWNTQRQVCVTHTANYAVHTHRKYNRMSFTEVSEVLFFVFLSHMSRGGHMAVYGPLYVTFSSWLNYTFTWKAHAMELHVFIRLLDQAKGLQKAVTSIVDYFSYD